METEDLKVCPRCGPKFVSEFNRKGKRLQSLCKECSRKASRVHYSENKPHYRKLAEERRDILRDYIAELKANTPCKDCGNFYPACVMDFDHQRDKKFEIGSCTIIGYSLETVKEEIAKCEIVCSNCHRIRTHLSEIGV